jgi:hypothetical protein
MKVVGEPPNDDTESPPLPRRGFFAVPEKDKTHKTVYIA